MMHDKKLFFWRDLDDKRKQLLIFLCVFITFLKHNCSLLTKELTRVFCSTNINIDTLKIIQFLLKTNEILSVVVIKYFPQLLSFLFTIHNSTCFKLFSITSKTKKTRSNRSTRCSSFVKLVHD